MGWVWYYLLPFRRGVARRNIQRALGDQLTPREQRRAVRRCFGELAMYGIEVLRVPLLTPPLAEELMGLHGFEHVEEGLKRGKGVILVTGHVGNIDLAGTCLATRGWPINVVAKELHWKPAQDFVVKVREQTTVRLIPPRRSKEQIKAALAKNEIMVLVVDQHMPKHRAIVCELFGQLAATSPAPARFAFETGATIVTGFAHRLDHRGHHESRVEPFELESPFEDLQANIRHNTERLNRRLEEAITRQPGEWLWLHKRWKVQDDPDGWEIPPHLQNLLPR